MERTGAPASRKGGGTLNKWLNANYVQYNAAAYLLKQNILHAHKEAGRGLCNKMLMHRSKSLELPSIALMLVL